MLDPWKELDENLTKMPKTSDIVLGGRIKALFVGKSGARKTTAAASFPGPSYFFDHDGRMDPVKAQFPLREDIEYDTYGIGHLDRAKRKMDALMRYPEKRTVVFDSLTSIGDTSIFTSRLSRDSGAEVNGVKIPDPKDYITESSYITQIIQFAKEYPGHVILTAHLLAIEETDPDAGDKMQLGKKKVTYSLITAGKKPAAKIPGYFSEVYYFYKEIGFDIGAESAKVATRAFSLGNGAVDAKSALGLPPIIDWTNKEFYSILTEELAKLKVNTDIPEPPPELPNSTWDNEKVSQE